MGTLLVVALTLLAVSAYYYFSTQLVSLEKLRAEVEMQKYSELTSQYVQISSAVATVEGNLVNFSVHIINTSDKPIPVFTAASWYVYNNGHLVAKGVGSCGPEIGPETPCTLYFTVLADKLPPPTEFSTVSVRVYVNRVPLNARVSLAGTLPGSSLFFVCKDCSSCNTVISNATPGSIIAVDVAHASGSCIDVFRKSKITLFCISPLSGSGSGTGISIVDSNDVTVRSCEILNFSKGIYFRNDRGVSLLSVYAHDNGQDVYLDPSTPDTLCDIGTVQAAATAGPLFVLRDVSSGSYTLYRASGIWIARSSDVSISGSSITLSRVTPAVALCSATSATLVGIDANNTDYGVFLYRDTGTTLSSSSFTAAVSGLISHYSSDDLIQTTVFTSPGDLFDLPNSVELGAGTVFRSGG